MMYYILKLNSSYLNYKPGEKVVASQEMSIRLAGVADVVDTIRIDSRLYFNMADIVDIEESINRSISSYNISIGLYKNRLRSISSKVELTHKLMAAAKTRGGTLEINRQSFLDGVPKEIEDYDKKMSELLKDIENIKSDGAKLIALLKGDKDGNNTGE